METLTKFLESASINGLIHVATSQKIAKLFWTLVVLNGFIFAGYLIIESFNSWADNPIRTTIETLPITELKFPNVTVCPPKNTLTDLNYDLVQSKNKVLSTEEKEELHSFFIEIVDENCYMDDWDKLFEENRFFNWYYGYTVITPKWRDGINNPVFENGQ